MVSGYGWEKKDSEGDLQLNCEKKNIGLDIKFQEESKILCNEFVC